MKTPLFQGICTALITPFRGDSVNDSMLKTLLNRQLEAGVRCIVICGTTGESPTLSVDEKQKLFETAKKFVGSDGLILAGTGCNCTESAVELSKVAQDCGADGLLVVSPYYNKATSQGLIAHYTAISQAVTIPVLLYNVPSRTGLDIPVSVYETLARLPNVCGVKEASPDLKKAAEIRLRCPEHFSLYSGNDDLLLPMLSLGADGLISVVSNLYPEIMISIWKRFTQGDHAGALAEYLKILPLIKVLFQEVNPIPVKKALEYQGFDCGGCRLPLTELSREHSTELKKIMETVF